MLSFELGYGQRREKSLEYWNFVRVSFSKVGELIV